MSIRQMAGLVWPFGVGSAQPHHGSHQTAAHHLAEVARAFAWHLSIGVLIFIGLNFLLLAYMTRFTLPGTSVNGQAVGLASRTAYLNVAEAAVNNTVAFPEVTGLESQTLSELGIGINAEATWRNATEVESFWTLPVIRLLTNSMTEQQFVYQINEGKLQSKLAQTVIPEYVESTNAKLQITDEGAAITDDRIGYEFNAAIAEEQIIEQLLSGSQNLQLRPSYTHAAVKTADLEPQAEAVNAALETNFTLTHKNKTIASLDSETLAELVTINKNGLLSIDRTGFYILIDESVRPQVEKPAKPARVARSGQKTTVLAPGKDGIVLDFAATHKAVVLALRSEQNTAAIVTEVDKAQNIVNGVYPKSNQGLQALIEDYDQNSSAEYYVAVEQLRGGTLSARHQAYSPVVPASTYKAFLSVVALHEIEQGNLSLSTSVGAGTVERCMFIMVHYSTNPCAIAIQNHIGAAKVDLILQELGFRETRLNNAANGGDKWTTAYDEYKLFRGLYDGTLLNKKHTDHLLNLFKNQSFRTGIPAASAPDVVADKIGFLGALTHDSALVYGQNYDYALIIMTNGGSFWSINGLASQINQFFRSAN